MSFFQLYICLYKITYYLDLKEVFIKIVTFFLNITFYVKIVFEKTDLAPLFRI